MGRGRSRLAVIMLFLVSVTMLSSATFGCSAAADTWPKKAIELTISFAPGGGSDVAGRVMAKYLAAELKVPVNVVNKPGGNQIPAIQGVLQAPPDGYTLLLDQPANSTIENTLPNLPFKIEDRSFGPMMLTGPNAYAINGKSPINSMKEFIDYYKAKPEELTWAGGSVSLTAFSFLQLFTISGIDPAKTKEVQFDGIGPGNTAVAGGHVVLGGGGAGSVVPLYTSKDLKVLAVTGDKRVPVLPDVPSAKELGLALTMMNWYSISGPKGLPKNVMDRLEAAAKKISEDPAYAKDCEQVASYPIYKTGADTQAYILKEAGDMQTLAKAIGSKK